MWSRIVSAVIVLAIVTAAAWALWPRPLSVETTTIARGDLQVRVEEDGISRIRDIFRVSAPTAGRLTRVPMHAGDSVTQGQTVASILPAGPGLLDDRSRQMAEAAAETAEAGITLAEATLAQAEAQSAFARTDLARTEALAERGLVSTQIEERATLEAATAAKSVEAAKASLLMRQRELKSAQAALIEGDDSAEATCCLNVEAPTSGRVLVVLTESEQVLQPGTPIMDIGDPADLEIAVDVLSSDAVRIVPGAAAAIEGWGGEPLRAEVGQIDPIATTKVSALGIEEQRTQVVLTLLDGPESREKLGHGYRVTASIVVWEGKDLVLVPMGALFRSGEDWAVFVVDDGKARLRVVTLDHRNADYAEVTGGLAGGEIIIVHPGDTVEDGRAVTAIAPLGGTVTATQ